MGSDEAADAGRESPGFSASSAGSVFFAQVRRGDFACLTAATTWLMKTTAALAVPQSISDELDFCASELLANIIGYAFDDDERHEVLIHLASTPGRIALTLEDDGCVFDPIASDDYVPPETLDDAGHRGYGVHLVRRFADEMLYRRERGRNIVTVVKLL
jgi:anti-sigma regulatory factor (Ser/Thr protein kinase)